MRKTCTGHGPNATPALSPDLNGRANSLENRRARAAFLDSWENVIRKNRFTLANLGIGNHALWLGPCNGRRGYCHADDSCPFGNNRE